MRVAARERRPRMTPPVELDDQFVDYPLGPAVARRRDAFERRGNVGDAQRASHDGIPRSEQRAASLLEQDAGLSVARSGEDAVWYDSSEPYPMGRLHHGPVGNSSRLNASELGAVLLVTWMRYATAVRDA